MLHGRTGGVLRSHLLKDLPAALFHLGSDPSPRPADPSSNRPRIAALAAQEPGTRFEQGRRAFLRAGAAFLTGVLLSDPFGIAQAADRPGRHALDGAPAGAELPRSLSFVHTHTRESVEAVYWCDGGWCREGLVAIDQILRDHRTDEVKEIDRDLLELLHDLRDSLGSTEPFQVVSGYRSPATNAALRRRSRRVAKTSLHMHGRAIDIRLPGARLNALHAAAKELQRGGVGYYPASNFVHVDTGAVRYW